MATPQDIQPGRAVLVGGGPGAWDLITLRGARALAEADVILTDHLGPTDQLDRIIGAERLAQIEVVDVSKLPYGRAVAQEETNRMLVDHVRAGRTVARLKGGDPYVFGRGFEEVQALAAAGFSCEVIPGVTSAVAVPGASGVPVTHRGVVHSFTVVSGHLPPGHPKSLTDWAALGRLGAAGSTIVVIMGVRNVGAITAALISAGLPASTPATSISDGTTDNQRSLRTTASALPAAMADAGIASPAVYVFGQVAGL